MSGDFFQNMALSGGAEHSIEPENYPPPGGHFAPSRTPIQQPLYGCKVLTASDARAPWHRGRDRGRN